MSVWGGDTDQAESALVGLLRLLIYHVSDPLFFSPLDR